MFERLYREIAEAAAVRAPAEMCGVIYAGRFIVLENAAPDPFAGFALSTQDVTRYMLDPQTQAIVHSHPPDTNEDGVQEGRLSPSTADMTQQIALKLPWVLTCFNPRSGAWETFEWGDHRLSLPILENDFRHGVEDCFLPIRRWWFQERGVLLPDVAREDQWWGDVSTGLPPMANLYVDLFKSYGFYRFEPASVGDLQPGDIFFFQLNSRIYNHAGIYIGDGKIIHHAADRLSVDEPVGRWFKRITYWIRRADA